MRWLTFAILIVGIVVAQSVLAPRLEWRGVRPDWVLVGVVFYALHTPARESVPAAWVAGALADLMTIERFGLLSLTYAVIAAIVSWAREWMFVRHPLTQFVVTFVAALLARIGWAVYRVGADIQGESAGVLIASAVYTALWAPPAHWLLLKMPRLLGIHLQPGTRGAGLQARQRRV